jgi:chromosome segregation ATPase
MSSTEERIAELDRSIEKLERIWLSAGDQERKQIKNQQDALDTERRHLAREVAPYEDVEYRQLSEQKGKLERRNSEIMNRQADLTEKINSLRPQRGRMYFEGADITQINVELATANEEWEACQDSYFTGKRRIDDLTKRISSALNEAKARYHK